MLNHIELIELEDSLASELLSVLSKCNRSGELDNLLNALVSFGFSNPYKSAAYNAEHDTFKDGKIVVVGDSEIKEEQLKGIAKALNIDKNRFEFVLGYGDAKKYNYSKLRYNSSYRVVMFGPVPHSTPGKGSFASTISNIEQSDGYPKVVRLTSNNQLKITKTNFRETLETLLKQEYI